MKIPVPYQYVVVFAVLMFGFLYVEGYFDEYINPEPDINWDNYIPTTDPFRPYAPANENVPEIDWENCTPTNDPFNPYECD